MDRRREAPGEGGRMGGPEAPGGRAGGRTGGPRWGCHLPVSCRRLVVVVHFCYGISAASQWKKSKAKSQLPNIAKPSFGETQHRKSQQQQTPQQRSHHERHSNILEPTGAAPTITTCTKSRRQQIAAPNVIATRITSRKTALQKHSNADIEHCNNIMAMPDDRNNLNHSSKFSASNHSINSMS